MTPRVPSARRRLLPLVVLSALAPVMTLAQQQAMDARVASAVERFAPAIIELRHRIHQNPELSNRELQTAKLVADHLMGLGLEVKTGVAITGVIGILRGGKPGPTVAVRADMDALPVTEETDLPFKSTVRSKEQGQDVGVAHACGHDIHTSSLLGVASILASMKEDVPGTVKFIFQPAEEGPPLGEQGGAKMMLEQGVLDNPKPGAIFALHCFPDLQVGQAGINGGPTMAAVDHFIARVRGTQSHGAYPHLGVDPIVMAAQAVLALQTIRSRNLPPLEASVVTVGIMRGGERFNILPAEVLLEGTVRTYNVQTQVIIERRMREILDGTTRAGGGTFELDYQRKTPATVNNQSLTNRMRPTLERGLGYQNVLTTEPTMGGEDFAYFANEIPGFYYRLGVVAPGTTSGGLHTPTFRADDSAILIGMRTTTHLILDWLQTEQPARPTPGTRPS